ncbi:MAG TPA: type ISP restriction/modification enzyme [Ktedonobacteraceae bacterium]
MRQQHSITSQVKHMSRIARAISEFVSTALEQGTASTTLRAAYRQCCEIHPPAMSITEFADMASHLLVYSCFVARYYHNDADSLTFQRQHIAAILFYAHPLQRQCVEAIMNMEPLATCIDEVVCLLATLDRQSIDSSFQGDPLTHFYELLLHYCNPDLRASHGIFYTPQPVISYIVRSIDYLLRSRFAYHNGLADIDANIHILDPACGTGVFVQAVLEHARAAYQQHGQAELWPAHLYQHFLPRLTGIEVLVTPYLIAHLRLNLVLADMDTRVSEEPFTQVGFSPEATLSLCHSERSEESLAARGFFASLRMTEAEDWCFAKNLSVQAEEPPMPFHLGNALSEPDHHQDAPDSIMIVLGNPPYAGHSANKEAWMLSLLDEYKEDCPELKKRAQAKWLSDDYVKFIRLAQWRIESAGQGILAFITSHSYLDNPTFRGMRHSLTRSFDELFVLDLHGNSKKQELAPGETRDENVFAIQSGIAISIFIKKKESTTHTPTISQAHVWGSRAEKLSWLAAHDLESTAWALQHPRSPHYLFALQETRYLEEYEAGWSIPDIFRPNGDPAPGIITCHDEFAVAWSRDEVMSNIEWLLATRDENEARQRYRLCAQEQWNYAAAKHALRDCEWQQQLTPMLYRPFDTRWTAYNRHVAVHLRERVTRHLLPCKGQSGQHNLALLIGKAGQVISGQTWDVVLCSRIITEFNLFRRGGNNIFPLYLASDDSSVKPDVNLAPAFIADVVARLGLQWITEGPGDLRQTIGPEDIFSYIYALLHAPSYRARYAAFLKHDFPRIPLPPNLTFFRALCYLGQQLVRLHLLESETPLITSYPVTGAHHVGRVRYIPHDDDKAAGRVWINAEQYFDHIPVAVWTLHIGGYQVCLKWLKDRKGRILTPDEITQYQKIVAALAETLRLMREIDCAIEQAGGWPIHPSPLSCHSERSEETARGPMRDSSLRSE